MKTELIAAIEAGGTKFNCALGTGPDDIRVQARIETGSPTETQHDVMEFLVAGATAVQIGTANFYNPSVSMQVLDALPGALAELGASRVSGIVRTMRLEQK